MSSRLAHIVERLEIRPGQTILEIGCGHGVAADLICQRLRRGKFIAIDRSARMIAAAMRRNARHIAAGIAEFHVADFEAFDPGTLKFDRVLAVRVGVFHRKPQWALAIVERWLKPKGRIVVEYDEPPNTRPGARV